MEKNLLGKYVRERRQDLGLTQEELAARIGGTATQAEISRLERGSVAFPRRSRLEALAVALEVSLGALLVNSGWLESDEGDLVEDVSTTQQQLDSSLTDTLLTEMRQIQESLLAAVARIGAVEEKINTISGPVQRPEVTVPTGGENDGEISARYEA
jgi:transcriptional regulator with XRE-family HTH domain